MESRIWYITSKNIKMDFQSAILTLSSVQSMVWQRFTNGVIDTE